MGPQVGGLGQMVGPLKVSPDSKNKRGCIHGHFYYLFWKMGQESAGRGHRGAW